MRERLIELLAEMSCKCNDTECENCNYNKEINCQEKMQADYLLENGVVVPPVKVGDVAFYIDIASVEQPIKVGVIDEIQVTKYGNAVVIKNVYTNLRRAYMFACIGKTVFFTREAAENALKEREKR